MRSTAGRGCRACRVVAGLALAGALVAFGLWRLSLPSAPDGFYRPPAPSAGAPPAAPGTLLATAPFDRGLPPGARAWRILYVTGTGNGTPAVASAVVLVPIAPAARPRPVVAWAHGTTGIVASCAPSLFKQPFPFVPALSKVIERGWAVVATDYIGLGVTGPAGVHPYLMGPDEAHAVLDAVRAAHHLTGAELSDQVLVWGHSQGGHAALWTGIVAPSYAPELRIAGVAALAPGSDLPQQVRRTQDTLAGRLIDSYIVTAYSELYPDVHFDAAVRLGARQLARDIARRCLDGRRMLASVAEAHLLGGSIFAADPSTGALGARLRQNVPDGHIAAPLLIAQGLDDPLVLADVQTAFVADRCRAGQALTYLTYPGRDHLSLIAPNSPLIAVLLAWSVGRLEGAPAEDRCPGRGL